MPFSRKYTKQYAPPEEQAQMKSPSKANTKQESQAVGGVLPVGGKNKKVNTPQSWADLVQEAQGIALKQGIPVGQVLGQLAGGVGEYALGGAYRTTQDIVAGIIANMTDATRQQAAQTAFKIAKDFEKRAQKEQNSQRRNALYQQANQVYQNISEESQNVSKTFSKDVGVNPFLRGIEAATQIAGTAGIVAHPIATAKGIAQTVLHPKETGKAILNTIEHPLEFIKGDYAKSFGGKLPGAQTPPSPFSIPKLKGEKIDLSPKGVEYGIKYNAALQAQQNPAAPKNIAKLIYNADTTGAKTPLEIAEKIKAQLPASALADKTVNGVGTAIDNWAKQYVTFQKFMPQQVPTQTQGSSNWQSFVDSAKKVASEVGFPVAVILGQAALETGRSSHPGNNFFGIKGSGTAGTQNLATQEATASGEFYNTKSNFAAYKSAEDSIRSYIDLIKRNYPQAWALRDNPVAMVQAIKAGGYATDPSYVQKVISTPEFQQFANTLSIPKAYAETKPQMPMQSQFTPAQGATYSTRMLPSRAPAGSVGGQSTGFQGQGQTPNMAPSVLPAAPTPALARPAFTAPPKPVVQMKTPAPIKSVPLPKAPAPKPTPAPKAPVKSVAKPTAKQPDILQSIKNLFGIK